MDEHSELESRAGSAGPTGQLKRRGVLAGVAALVGGLLARAAAKPAEAANSDPVLQGVANGPYLGSTQLNRSNGMTPDNALRVTNNNGTAIRAESPIGNVVSVSASAGGNGIQVDSATGLAIVAQLTGSSNSNAAISGSSGPATSQVVVGVLGATNNGAGVKGTAGGQFGNGVLGTSPGTGVKGQSTGGGVGVEGGSSNIGVHGVGTLGVVGDSGRAGGFGVFGHADDVGVFGAAAPITPMGAQIGVKGVGNNIGVRGEGAIGVFGAGSGSNPGVLGSATNGYGVFGMSQNSNGIAGQGAGTAAGGVGFAGAAGGYGIYGGTAVPGGYAGGFAGPVLVVGDFAVSGGAKNAAVPHPDGSHRLLYCQESPEPWFEDFGEAKLVGGRADVKLDPDFAAVVHSDNYQVFLTEYGDSGGLFVANRGQASFEVRARGSANASGTVGYRVVARRKDIPGPRLEKITLPKPIKELVKPPDPPKGPEAPPRAQNRVSRAVSHQRPVR